MSKYAEFKNLVGKTLSEIKISDDKEQIRFLCNDGTEFLMYHEQDCCENVTVEDITGDLSDMLNTPILAAVVASSLSEDENGDSNWTFYNMATRKGYLSIRWYGTSNGYYSTAVSFIKENEPAN